MKLRAWLQSRGVLRAALSLVEGHAVDLDELGGNGSDLYVRAAAYELMAALHATGFRLAEVGPLLGLSDRRARAAVAIYTRRWGPAVALDIDEARRPKVLAPWEESDVPDAPLALASGGGRRR